MKEERSWQRSNEAYQRELSLHTHLLGQATRLSSSSNLIRRSHSKMAVLLRGPREACRFTQ